MLFKNPKPLQLPCFILARFLHFREILASSWNYYHFKCHDEYKCIPILVLLLVISQGSLPNHTPLSGTATSALKDRTLFLQQLHKGNGYTEVPQHCSSSDVTVPLALRLGTTEKSGETGGPKHWILSDPNCHPSFPLANSKGITVLAFTTKNKVLIYGLQ